MTLEYEYEPIKGLPYKLPEGEKILWQGSPRWLTLAKHLCHIRFVTGYFVLLIGWAIIAANADGRTLVDTAKAVAWLFAMMGVVVGLLGTFAYLCGRTTIYTITTKRVVLRYGIALNKAVNVSFRVIEGAGLRLYPDGSGDIPLNSCGVLQDRVSDPLAACAPMAIPEASANAARGQGCRKSRGGPTVRNSGIRGGYVRYGWREGG